METTQSKSKIRYRVTVYDMCGEFDWAEFSAFWNVPAAVRVFRRLHPGTVIQVVNLNRCDYDTDGLTEDEREAVNNVDVAA